MVARTDQPDAAGEDLSRRPLVAKALAERSRRAGIWQEGDRLFYAVAVPMAPSSPLLGFLVTGFAIDDASAREVNGVSGADVAFVAMAASEPQVVATTLARDDRGEPARGAARPASAMMGRVDERGRGDPRRPS